MLRPLLIGVPAILLIAGAFAAGMALVPPQSPYFKWVIIGYAVLFPLTLVTMIVATIRSVRRAMNGGDVRLKQTGRQGRAKVIEARRSPMSMRVNRRYLSVWTVTLEVEDIAGPRIRNVQRAVSSWQASPRPGDIVTIYTDPQQPSRMFVDWPQAPAGMVATGTGVNLDAFSPEIADLVRRGLQMAEGSKAASERGASVGGAGLSMAAAGDAAAAKEEGRARIEGLQPNPDGTYELDLIVTPRSRESYRLAIVAPVPHEKVADIRRGQYLKVRLDPADTAWVEIVWD